MSGSTITRREFIELLAAMGLTFVAGSGCVPRSASSMGPELSASGVLTPADAPCGSLREPQRLGKLTHAEAQELWSVFVHIGAAWGNAKYCILQDIEALRPILDAKTDNLPSYLYEYQSAIEVLAQLRQQYGHQEALQKFLFAQPDSCARKYVVAEFINLQISQGGFRRFGYKNYVGFMGGPFDDVSRLPYRTHLESV